MKHATHLCFLLSAFCFLAGCTSLNPDQKLSLVRTVATEASYVGAAYDLKANPAHRAMYAAAKAALDGLVSANDFNPEHLRTALANLPSLRGGSGAVLIDTGVSIYTVSLGFVDIQSAPYAQAVVVGIRDGLARALARPTGPATMSLAPPLPKQITVPKR